MFPFQKKKQIKALFRIVEDTVCTSKHRTRPAVVAKFLSASPNILGECALVVMSRKPAIVLRLSLWAFTKLNLFSITSLGHELSSDVRFPEHTMLADTMLEIQLALPQHDWHALPLIEY